MECTNSPYFNFKSFLKFDPCAMEKIVFIDTLYALKKWFPSYKMSLKSIIYILQTRLSVGYNMRSNFSTIHWKWVIICNVVLAIRVRSCMLLPIDPHNPTPTCPHLWVDRHHHLWFLENKFGHPCWGVSRSIHDLDRLG